LPILLKISVGFKAAHKDNNIFSVSCGFVSLRALKSIVILGDREY